MTNGSRTVHHGSVGSIGAGGVLPGPPDDGDHEAMAAVTEPEPQPQPLINDWLARIEQPRPPTQSQSRSHSNGESSTLLGSAVCLPHMWDTRCWADGCEFAGSPERLKKCVDCRTARYCSKQCQRADWSVHRYRCQGVGMLASVARTVVHPRCVMARQDPFDNAVRGYVVLGTGHGASLGSPSWDFVKLSQPEKRRALLQEGLGLLRRGEWFVRAESPDYLQALHAMWRLFYLEDGVHLGMVACESLESHAESGVPIVVVREKKAKVSRRTQKAIAKLASGVGMGVIFDHQPCSKTRLDIVGDDPSMLVISRFVLTPALLREYAVSGLSTPRDGFVRMGLAPLLPVAL